MTRTDLSSGILSDNIRMIFVSILAGSKSTKPEPGSFSVPQRSRLVVQKIEKGYGKVYVSQVCVNEEFSCAKAGRRENKASRQSVFFIIVIGNALA